MTPDTIMKATKALASDTTSWSEARSAGEAFGRALAAQIRARAIATEQMNQAATTEIEMSLLQLAASGDELVAEIADSALRELHLEPGRLEIIPDARQ